MSINSKVNVPNCTSAELLSDKISNLFMREIPIIEKKVFSDSPNSTCNIIINGQIMFSGKYLTYFACFYS